MSYYYHITIDPNHPALTPDTQEVTTVPQTENISSAKTAITTPSETDHVPTITVTTPLSATIAENDNVSLFHWLQGTSNDGEVRFSLADDYDGPLQIVGDILAFKATHKGFDFETDGATHIIPIIAKDGNSELAFDFTIQIIDVSETISEDVGSTVSDGFA